MPMETLRFEGSEINCFLRDQSSNNRGCRSIFAGNKALLPTDVIDFAMLPAQRFWQETVSLLAVM